MNALSFSKPATVSTLHKVQTWTLFHRWHSGSNISGELKAICSCDVSPVLNSVSSQFYSWEEINSQLWKSTTINMWCKSRIDNPTHWNHGAVGVGACCGLVPLFSLWSSLLASIWLIIVSVMFNHWVISVAYRQQLLYPQYNTFKVPTRNG